MAMNSEALDILESKVQELELRVFGEKSGTVENSIPIIESLLQANTILTAALSGREKCTSMFKRLNELNNYLELNPLSEDPAGLKTKLDIILSVKNEYQDLAERMEKVNELSHILDDDKIKNVMLLSDELNSLICNHLEKKEKLNEFNNEVGELLTLFNTACIEVTKSLFLFNDALSIYESGKK